MASGEVISGEKSSIVTRVRVAYEDRKAYVRCDSR